jgi:hypothetical protein
MVRSSKDSVSDPLLRPTMPTTTAIGRVVLTKRLAPTGGGTIPVMARPSTVPLMTALSSRASMSKVDNTES